MTGYTPPTPYKSYQESDPYGNVCQADGATWGQEVGTGDPSNDCYETCGMHHIVSFHELSDHPWAGWFGEPSLAVSAEALVHTVTFSGESEYNMAWGMSALCSRIRRPAIYLSTVLRSGARHTTHRSGGKSG